VKAADSIKAADKITGVESVKVADKADVKAAATAQAPIGANNTAVGGNMQQTTINDKDVINQNEKHWYLICLFILVAWGRAEIRNNKLLNLVIAGYCEQICRLEKILADELAADDKKEEKV
jgi:hypothetical protein